VGGPIDDVLDRLAAADLRLVAVALVVQCVALALRGRAWRSALAGATPPVRARTSETTAALVAGMAINGLLPGRVGEGVKVGLLRYRSRESSIAGIAGALAALSPCDVALVGLAGAGALLIGVAPGLDLPPAASAVVVALVVLAGCTLLLHRRLAQVGVVRALLGGAALLRRPRAYGSGVALPLLMAFGLRLVVAALMLAAFGLTPTLGAALIVFAAGGLARTVPLGSGSLAAEGVLLVAAFGGAESTADVVAFTAGAGAALLALHLCVGLVASALLLGTVRPGAAAARARAALA